MAIDFQLESSRPHVPHFPRYLTVAPSCPTSTTPFPATARTFFGWACHPATKPGPAAGSPSAGATVGSPVASPAGGVPPDTPTNPLGSPAAPAPSAGAASVVATAGAGRKRLRIWLAGTPSSTPSCQTVSVGRTSPAAARPDSSAPDIGPVISEPRP